MATTSPSTKPAEAITTLKQQLGRTWPHISASAGSAATLRNELDQMLVRTRLIPADCSFIVFGSLARDETTIGSDLDWTLLVDGQAAPEHVTAAQSIEAEIAKLRHKEPGRTGLFGGLAFSHELVHQIGGQTDTNRNTTQRILLLLESRAICSSEARDRVMRGVLRRYLEEDRGYNELHDAAPRVPRFLLNDIVRFWRTLTVDYAAKRRDREWEGWALRNFKLRMSRKLTFAAGLAMCMSCQLNPSATLSEQHASPSDFYAALQDFLMEFSNQTPLNTLASFALQFGPATLAGEILDAYDEFLRILMDVGSRERLENMELDDAIKSDPLFQETRQIGSAFEDSLTKLFFGTNDTLTTLTQRYGVF